VKLSTLFLAFKCKIWANIELLTVMLIAALHEAEAVLPMSGATAGQQLETANKTLCTWSSEQYAAVAIRLLRAIKAEYPEAKVGINGGFTKDWFCRVIPLVWRDIDFLVVRANTALDQAVIPDDFKKRWPLCLTETSSYHPGHPVNNDLEEATRNFIRMGLNLYSPRVTYMHFWADRAADCFRGSGKNALSLDGDLLPMGQVLSIGNEYLKSQMVQVESSSKEVVFATINPQTRALTLFLANQEKESRSATVTIDGVSGNRTATMWAFTGTSPHDLNPRWEQQVSQPIHNATFSRNLSRLGFVMLDMPP